MSPILGYTPTTKIYESISTIVYRAYRDKDNKSVILKVLKENNPYPNEELRYKNEYMLTKILKVEGVTRPITIEKINRALVLIFEDFGGESLKTLLITRNFTLRDLLKIASNIISAIDQIHSEKVIHKDINPANIVLNPENFEVKLIDFGIAFIAAPDKIINETKLKDSEIEGNLSYISPEQTGRANLPIDFRSDYYSFGITLYEIFTKRLPFVSNDPVELIHSHVARNFKPPYELDSSIPKIISDIIMKLIAKSPDDRYQNSKGIKADIEKCLKTLDYKGYIEEFPLGTQDIRTEIIFSDKLYGRDSEIKSFTEILQHNGAIEIEGENKANNTGFDAILNLITGYQGIGKTAFLDYFFKSDIKKKGYYVYGKFDKFEQNTPYRGLIRAIKDLLKQILGSKKEEINNWAEKIIEAVGSYGQILIDVVPELKLIIGKQPELTEVLNLEQGQNRFNIVVSNFFKIFCQNEKSLVLFLDDIHFADNASIRLIESLMSSKNRNLIINLVYRDNELDSSHPLKSVIKEIKEQKNIVNQIHLMPFCFDDVNHFISDILGLPHQISESLASAIYAKTQGNPFFIKEYVKLIFSKQYLYFDLKNMAFKWELDKIRALDISDNVFDFMLQKINDLCPQTKEILSFAACIGNRFEIDILASIYGKPMEEISIYLKEAISEGLILEFGETNLESSDDEYDESLLKMLYVNPKSEDIHHYRFAYTGIQQAAYSLVPEQKKKELHRFIGLLIYEKTPSRWQNDMIFDVVYHINLGKDLIDRETFTTFSEVDQFAALNLKAGKRAISSTAFKEALNYFLTGLGILNQNDWSKQYELMSELYIEGAKAACVTGDFKLMNELIQNVLLNSTNVLDEAKVYEVKIQGLIAQNKLLDAVHAALEILKKLRIKFPSNPTKLDILVGYIKTKIFLRNKSFDEILYRHRMYENEKLAAMRIIVSVFSAAYITLPKLYPLLIFKGVTISIKEGNCPESIYAYACYGGFLCGVIGDVKSGYEFGELSLKLIAHLKANEIKAKIYTIVYNFIKHWKENIGLSLGHLLEGYKIGLKTGDFEYASYNAFGHSCCSLFTGQEISKCEEDIKNFCGIISQFKHTTALNYIQAIHQAILNFAGKSKEPCRLMGEVYNEDKMLPIHKQANDRFAIFMIYLNRLIMNYILEKYQQAHHCAQLAETYIDGALASIGYVLFYFYDSLVKLALYNDLSKSEQKIILKKVKSNQKKLKKWAKFSPSNYDQKVHLIEAEFMRVTNRFNEGINFYDKAIELAKKNNYLNEEGLANELAAKFCISQKKYRVAKLYMEDAYICYLKWGAKIKIKHLEDKYREYLEISEKSAFLLQNLKKIDDVQLSEGFDLLYALKAAQAISSEIKFDKLKNKLIKIVNEASCSERGFLLLNEGKDLTIQASSSTNKDEEGIEGDISFEHYKSIATSIISYVARTHESVMINNASEEHYFANDEHILSNKPKSILCLPIINHGNFIGILYLENNKIAGAFTKEHLQLIQILASQAAISIENARLYSQLEGQK
ncbi:MAG: AAA family ATPase [Desulfobacterales bacterium]|nr:AAA family ATPase [Desulfobacterales bacterium]